MKYENKSYWIILSGTIIELPYSREENGFVFACIDREDNSEFKRLKSSTDGYSNNMFSTKEMVLIAAKRWLSNLERSINKLNK